LDEKAEYEQRLVAAIRGILSEQEMTFFDIVRSCKGAYPTVVRDALSHLGLEVKHGTLESYRLLPSSSGLRTAWRSLLDEIEGNPVLSSWYFTPDTCERIGALRSWSGLRLAFLGTPRLFEWFATHNLGKQRILFDLDEQVLRALEKVVRNTDRVVHYDANHEIPEEFCREFDYVFFDPPWYPRDYAVWFQRAVSLSSTGQMVFSLFQDMLRPSAAAERRNLFHDLIEPASSQTILSSFLQYEIPTFENAELRAAGFTVLLPWKTADLAIIKTVKPKQCEHPQDVGLEGERWTEIDIGKVRVFVSQNHVPEHQHSLLAQPSTGLVLSSPSRRNPARQMVNILTSRGHGLITSRPNEFVTLLKLIATRPGYPGTASFDGVELDPQSRTLLETILRSDNE
jgi:hypothetical protein